MKTLNLSRSGRKIWCAFALSILLAQTGIAQQTVSIGSTTIKSNAVLFLSSSGKNQGVIIPVVNSRNTITGSGAEAGMLVFDDTDKKVYYYNGTAWVEAGGGSGGTTVTLTPGQNITITGAFPNFTIAAPNVDAVVGNEVTTVNTARGGLEIGGAGTAASPLSIGLIQGTAADQILKWDNTNRRWVLGTDNSGGAPAVDNVTIENVGNLRVKDGGITTAKIANDGVTRDKIAADVAGTGLVQVANGSLSVDVGTTANKIVQLDGSARLPAVDGSQLTNLPGGGDITGVTAGAGLTGGGTTGAVSLAADVGTTAGKLVQLDGSARLPAVDGSQLTNLPGGGDITGVTAGTGLTGGGATGAVSLAADVGTTAGKLVQLDGSARLPPVDGSQLTNLPGGGDITGVTAGTGLTGGGATGAVSLAADVGTTAGKLVQLDGSARLPAVDGSQLINLPGGGDITGVTAGTGLTGGGATGAVSLAADVGTTAGKLVQLDGSARLPAVDGSQLINLPVGGDITAVTAGTGLTGGGATGAVSLAADVGTTAGKLVQLDGSARLPAVDGSQLTNLPSDIAGVTAGTGLTGGGTTGTVSIALANTTVVANTYGSATVVPVITVDAQGRLTNVTTATVPDASATNEIQNLSFTGTGTVAANETFPLAISGGTGVTVREGTNIQIDHAANVLTINATSGGSSFSTLNVIPKGDGAGLVSSSVTDNATTLSTTNDFNLATGKALFINNVRMLHNTGTNNIFLGALAGNANTAINNTFIGAAAGQANTSGAESVYVGRNAGAASLSGSFNTYIGKDAGATMTAGGLNTFVGFAAGGSGNNADSGTFIGANAGENTSGDFNTFVGESSGTGNTSGTSNVFIGHNTGTTNITGGSITLIGKGANVSGTNYTNATAIGANAIVGASNTIVLGNGSVDVGIGTSTPRSVLELQGGNLILSGSTASPADAVDIDFKTLADVFKAKIWTAPTTNTLWFSTSIDPTNNKNITIDPSGRTGINRTPTANPFEVEGEASKTAAGDWAANSDARIKTDIRDVTDGIETVKRLRPVKFKYTNYWRGKHPSIKDQYYYNFIAQEFREVFPEAVRGSGEFIEGDPQEVLQVDTYNAQIVTIKAVQELIDKVEKLEKENQQLKQQNQVLETELRAEIARIKEALGMEATAK